MKEYKNTHNYVITSGWWCGAVEDEKRVRYGSESIREKEFFPKWKQSVLNHCSPQKVMVLDSASPTRPDTTDLEGVEFLSINENPGHATNHKGKFCGYTRSIIMGITYAKLCDADYWVYVEQDVLLRGEGIIEYCIDRMSKPYMFGAGDGTPQYLQQSLIIIRKDGFDSFLKNLSAIKAADGEVNPESKFLIASSWFYRLFPEWLYLTAGNTYLQRKFRKFVNKSVRWLKGYDELPIGYGRARPIEFGERYFYFQHGTEEEVAEYYSEHRT